MRECRKPITENTDKAVIEKIFSVFTYDEKTGEIYNVVRNRYYHKKTKKGYRSDIYIFHERIEYYIKYHRLCWLLHYKELVPDNKQIDHRDNIKDNNAISNLRICTNDDNSKKKLLRKDNSFGYKGVSTSTDKNKYGYTYKYFTASIASIPKENSKKIGRFKDPKIAAKFYDSAARFYFKDYAVCNFSKIYIRPMSINELRIYKKQNKL